MDWIQFFEDNGIDYATRGPNTRKDEISIPCPWCGDDDPSQHLSINLTKGVYGCWRNATHKGASAPRLIAALVGCGMAQARLIAAQYEHANPDDLSQALASLTPTSEAPKPFTRLTLPADTRPIAKTGITERFWRYLARRHFDDVDGLIARYGLRCCLTGRWKDRILIPFYHDGELVGWTARAIGNPVNAPRYLSSGDAIKKTIFNHDHLLGGHVLFIVEGPFDALKLDFYGTKLGADATCVFGTHMSMDQIYLLSRIGRTYDKVVILLDKDAVEPAFYAEDWLQAKNVKIGQLPDGVKDAGEMAPQRVVEFIKRST